MRLGALRLASAERVPNGTLRFFVFWIAGYALSPDTARAGGSAVLIGPGLSIEDMGYEAGTIGYEILTRLGGRFERVWAGERT